MRAPRASGDDLEWIEEFLKGAVRYSAVDVLDWRYPSTIRSSAARTGSTSSVATRHTISGSK
jgi:hypothetical protein